jgi:hypothetical protein
LSNASIQERLRPPVAKAMQIAAAQLHRPLQAPVSLNFRNGLRPDQATVLAVILRPKLRADRDRKGMAAAQLVQAEILPNPQIGYTHDFLTGGNTAGTISTYGFSGSWDISALITTVLKLAVARGTSRPSISISAGRNDNLEWRQNGTLSAGSSRRGTTSLLVEHSANG